MARKGRGNGAVASYKPPSLHERMETDADMMASTMAREHPMMKRLHKDMKCALMKAGKGAMRCAGKNVRRVRSS